MAVLLCSNITYPLLVDIHLTFNSLSPRSLILMIDPTCTEVDQESLENTNSLSINSTVPVISLLPEYVPAVR